MNIWWVNIFMSPQYFLRMRDTKESTCLLRHITNEKSGLCQNTVCIIVIVSKMHSNEVILYFL